MKTTKTLFGVLTISLAYLGTTNLLKAETFFGLTPTNRFLIGTNESVLIDSAALAPNNVGYVSFVLQSSTISYPVAMNIGFPTTGPFISAFSGPAELITTNLNPCALHFTRLTNSSVKMLLWPANNTNLLTVSVPAGNTFQLLSVLGGDNGDSVIATITYGVQSFIAQLLPGQLLNGPLTVQFARASNDSMSNFGNPVALASYWFIEDVFQNPNSVLAGGIGAARVLVQKSSYLTNWQPVAIFPAALGNNSFYRLQISH